MNQEWTRTKTSLQMAYKWKIEEVWTTICAPIFLISYQTKILFNCLFIKFIRFYFYNVPIHHTHEAIAIS